MKYLSLCVAMGMLSACSSVSRLTDTTGLIDYSNHKSVKVLEMPADLKAPEYDRTYLTTVSDNAAQGDTKVSDAVPTVDGDLTSPSSPSSSSTAQLSIVDRGSESALRIASGYSWQKTEAALKAMGMTVNKADESAGLFEIRGRSQVSEPGSMIGDFLNRTIGRLNQGAFYQTRVVREGSAAFIVFRNGEGGELSAEDAKSLLNRFSKEYSDA